MMKNVLVPALLALTIPAAALPLTAAAAQTQDVCQTDISVLRSDTQTVTITGKSAEKDRAALLGKLDDASSKLSIGKTADAIQKLTDFSDKVQQLAAAGKISPIDAAELAAGADQAIACLSG